MKKTMLILAVALIAAAGVYAEGRREDPLAASRNKVALTGTLQFADGVPVISADGKTYNLFAPRLMRQAYTLKPGIPLTVEGFIVQPRPRMGKDSSPAFTRESIFVRTVTIDGKTIQAGGRGEFRGHGRGDERRGFCDKKDGSCDGKRGEGHKRGFGKGPENFRDKSGQGYGKDWGNQPRKWN